MALTDLLKQIASKSWCGPAGPTGFCGFACAHPASRDCFAALRIPAAYAPLVGNMLRHACQRRCALRLHFARQLRTRAARPSALQFKLAPHPPGAAEGTGPVKHGPAPWWGSIDACELPFLFSPSEPPPALGKSPVPVARQPAALSRHKRPPEKMDEHLFHVRRNPGLSHPCHVPFTGLGPFG